MRIRKAVITAAGPNQRALPLQTLIDRDGAGKAGARASSSSRRCAPAWKRSAWWCGRATKARYAQAAGGMPARLRFIRAAGAAGYGHAILCAREFVGQRSVSAHGRRSPLCQPPAQGLRAATGGGGGGRGVRGFRRAGHARNLLPHYRRGGRAARRGQQDLYRVETVIEKPTPTEAEQRLMVPGMRAGYYLCFFGMHVLTPAVMDLLGAAARRTALPPALAELAEREQYLALEDRRPALRHRAARTACCIAQLALALSGRGSRTRCCRRLVELLALREMTAVGSSARVSQLTGIITPAIRRCATGRWTRSAGRRRLPSCWRNARRWIASGARATTCTNACARCFSCTPSIASTLPLQARQAGAPALIPFAGYEQSAEAPFRGGDRHFPGGADGAGPSAAISSALAAAYRALGFQTLADQVRRSVRSVRGNQWMFRMGHPADHPLRLRPELLRAARPSALPDPARDHAGAHGPDPQRLERHFLPGHGFPGGRAGAECLDRPGRARRAMPRRSRRWKRTCA